MAWFTAGVAKAANAMDLKSIGPSALAGSNPAPGTNFHGFGDERAVLVRQPWKLFIEVLKLCAEAGLVGLGGKRYGCSRVTK